MIHPSRQAYVEEAPQVRNFARNHLSARLCIYICLQGSAVSALEAGARDKAG